MSQTAWTELISNVHGSDRRLVLAVTGGGTKAISQLFDVAGASRSMLEAVVPYAAASQQRWLGGAPEQSCSEPTARLMAMAAWMRARELAPEVPTSMLVGVGATASLATDRPKRGEHRVHVAVQTEKQTSSLSLTLAKDARDRKKEQWMASRLILLAAGEVCEVDTAAAAMALNKQLLEGEQINRVHQDAEAEWTALLTGRRNCVVVPSGAAVEPQVVLSGAFNPLHAGHQRMAELAAKRLGKPVVYELSITNVDKPSLDFVEIRRRLEGFRQQEADATLVLTDAPTFRAKSALFGGCTFVVGADTIVRIADPRYYPGERAGYDAAIRLLAERDCRFLVFGRLVDGQFRSLAEMAIPEPLRRLCDEVTEEEFRQDVSSTDLRGEAGEISRWFLGPQA
ncbi:MAG: hypothetical protein GXP26_16005 [Planctomycetes bacterium]|nr:hypothetical protein [Planctomycetota bacterium]